MAFEGCRFATSTNRIGLIIQATYKRINDFILPANQPAGGPDYKSYQVLSARICESLFEAMKDYDDYNTTMNFAGKYLKATSGTSGGNPVWDPTGIHGSNVAFSRARSAVAGPRSSC
eukprot:10917123-Heterocapsa_arctica.AAC.1